MVSTIVGGGVGTFVDGTGLNGPICLTVDTSNNIFVSNLYENKIRKVTPAAGAHALIELVCRSYVEKGEIPFQIYLERSSVACD